MPDKKITQATENVSPILGTDVLPMVGNVAIGTPTNFKVQVKNFLSQIQIDLPQTTFSAFKITASVTANANVATQAAGEFNMLANSSIGATGQDRYGLIVTNKIQNGNTIITGQFAAVAFTLDTGNSNTVAGNTFGMVVRHFANTAPRTTAPRAFMGLFEDANTGAATSYVLDIGAGGKPVSSSANASANVIFSPKGASVTSHVLKISVNGTDLWLHASNVAPA